MQDFLTKKHFLPWKFKITIPNDFHHWGAMAETICLSLVLGISNYLDLAARIFPTQWPQYLDSLPSSKYIPLLNNMPGNLIFSIKEMFLHFPHELRHFLALKIIFRRFSGCKARVMGFILECCHKVDLEIFQCPNEKSDLHQLNFCCWWW